MTDVDGSTSGHPHAGAACPFCLSELVLRMAAGDAAACARLYDRIGPLVFEATCRAQPADADGGDVARRAAAEAATVEAFVVMWRRAPTFDPATTSVVTWLAGCLRAVTDRSAAAPSRTPAAAEHRGAGEGAPSGRRGAAAPHPSTLGWWP